MPVFSRFPVLKTMSAYLVINALADFNEQVFIKKRTKDTYKYAKTARITVVGTFVISPIIFSWIRLAEKILPGRGVRTVVFKVLLDQIFIAPLEISTFYISTNILEGKTDVFEEWRQKFLKTWTTGLLFWPLAQSINFSMVSPPYRTSIFMPLCSLTWTTYLCYMKELQIKEHISPAQDGQPLQLNSANEREMISITGQINDCPVNSEQKYSNKTKSHTENHELSADYRTVILQRRRGFQKNELRDQIIIANAEIGGKFPQSFQENVFPVGYVYSQRLHPAENPHMQNTLPVPGETETVNMCQEIVDGELHPMVYDLKHGKTELYEVNNLLKLSNGEINAANVDTPADETRQITLVSSDQDQRLKSVNEANSVFT